jgi:general secretion pathway protein A
MYTSFFGLTEKPFSITPDPRYLYLSERHAEALAHLIYGVKESGGFIQLTGEVGTGKTTLVRSLLEQVPESTDVAVVLNPQLSRSEFLCAICEELNLPLPTQTSSIKALTDTLNQGLLRNHGAGRRTILIVDEAQNLRVEVLEQVRLLTNLETAKQKLLQIILIGQPELREVLARNDLRQLAQRVTGRYHLEPLTPEETLAYVDHRLRVAGAVGAIFTVPAKRELHRISGGVPRMINVVADRALLGAYTTEQTQVTPELVRAAAAEVYGPGARGPGWWRQPRHVAAVAGVVAGVLLLSTWAGMTWMRSRAPAAPPPAAAPPAPLPSTAAPPAPDSAPPADASPPPGAVPPAGPAAVAPPAPAVAAPVIVPVAPLLREYADLAGTDAAFATLFDLWGLDYGQATGRPCEQAAARNLQCLYQQGTLEQVQALGRPVILTLRDAGGSPYQAVLAGLGPAAATLRFGATEHQVALDDLQRHWSGEYLLLWRPVTSRQKPFMPGTKSPDVRWLRQSLATVQGAPVEPMASDVYDDALADRVRDYQRDRGLPVDGLAGQVTLAALGNEVGDDDLPRLQRLN